MQSIIRFDLGAIAMSELAVSRATHAVRKLSPWTSIRWRDTPLAACRAFLPVSER